MNKQFVTEVEIADENGNVEIFEVVTELPAKLAEIAEQLRKTHGGAMSHNEIVAKAKAAV